MKILLRDRDQIGKSAVVIQDSQYCSIRAVCGKAPAAGRTRPAGAVDLAYDAAAGKRARLGHSNEFVPKNAAEAHVALDQLEVRLADSRTDDPDQDFTRGWCWRRPRGRQLDSIVENNRAHVVNRIRNDAEAGR